VQEAVESYIEKSLEFISDVLPQKFGELFTNFSTRYLWPSAKELAGGMKAAVQKRKKEREEEQGKVDSCINKLIAKGEEAQQDVSVIDPLKCAIEALKQCEDTFEEKWSARLSDLIEEKGCRDGKGIWILLLNSQSIQKNKMLDEMNLTDGEAR